MTAYRRPRLPVALPATLAVAALLLVACGEGGGSSTPDQTENPGTSTVTATASPPQASAAERPLGQPDLAAKTREIQWSEDFIILDNIRAGRHEGFDRVVFDFTDGADPGWQIDYVAEPLQQGSGLPVEMDGDTFLHVMFTNTTYPFELGMENAFEPGNYPGAGVVKEIAYTGIFEGYTEAYIGLDEELPYSVTLLHHPTRVVIDFQHE